MTSLCKKKASPNKRVGTPKKKASPSKKCSRSGIFSWDKRSTMILLELCLEYQADHGKKQQFKWPQIIKSFEEPELKFPRPPAGKYYLVDRGYPDRDGFLTPYPDLKYHLDEFAARRPKNAKEAFNRAHSSLRSSVERSFGVLKQRWHILTNMPAYSLKTQTDITIACFALHNYIRRHTLPDGFVRFASNYQVAPSGLDVENPEPIPLAEEVPTQLARGMVATRETIAHMIWNERRGR